ncbi:acyl carrier protein [Solihabitans fulvus]|uniref:Acyl carrier protein n=1 Tax=Solihabitans fulvus TaxID=1892852 RepID=A0A5B2XSF8_9PSEU|nr:phosphopantetheine-binding protein [Solihabitans fulvus]KAA2265789.1 acyl carrier protein [Solihabitans fulvus]
MTESVQAGTTAPGDRTEAGVRELVRSIVIELSPGRDESAGPDAGLIETLGYNSLALIELAFTLEDEFDLAPIEEATARQITTISRVEDHVVNELAGRGELVADP